MIGKLLLIIYFALYFRLVRRPKLYFQPNEKNKKIVKLTPALSKLFFPFFIIGFGYIESKMYRFRQISKRNYKRIFIDTDTPDKIAIDIYECDNEVVMMINDYKRIINEIYLRSKNVIKKLRKQFCVLGSKNGNSKKKCGTNNNLSGKNELKKENNNPFENESLILNNTSSKISNDISIINNDSGKGPANSAKNIIEIDFNEIWKDLKLDLDDEKNLKETFKTNNLSAESNEDVKKESPINNILLVHGFCSSSKSTYISNLAFHLKKYRVFAFNARGTLTELMNSKFFHIGHIEDIQRAADFILNNYDGTLILVGFSMGSSWVTKYLSHKTHPRVIGGCGICVPFNFLRLREIFSGSRTEKKLVEEFKGFLKKHKVFDSFDYNFESIESIDENVTVKVFGFKNTTDYYKSQSIEEKLTHIKKPMLFINSMDDPIIPLRSIPVDKILNNPNLILCMVKTGGHLGFLGLDWRTTFIERSITDYVDVLNSIE